MSNAHETIESTKHERIQTELIIFLFIIVMIQIPSIESIDGIFQTLLTHSI
jgi:hypothetical protein